MTARNTPATTKPAASRAIVPATPLGDDEMTAALRAAGLIEPERGGGDYPQRAKVDGLTISLGDEMYVSNPKTKAPAFRARLIDVPVEYQGVFLDDDLARAINRSGDAGTYCKSFFAIEDQKREFSEDGHNCRECPINPFTKRDALPLLDNGKVAKKCQWRAEVAFQVLDAEGAISDDTVWTLDLSTTSVIEFKGTQKTQPEGSVSEFNFMQKLARFGAASTPDDPTTGFRNALNALALGLVIVDVRQIPTSKDGVNWNVTSFDPVQILESEATAAIEAGDIVGDDAPADAPQTDDLPF